MSRDIILMNTSNYQGSNKYSYRFPTPTSFKNCKLSLHSLSMYNSTYNISSVYNNNTFSITWSNSVTYNITIPDGYYSFSDLDNFLAQQMILLGLYCTSNNGTQNVYFLRFQSNASLYKAQIDCYYIPTASDATTLGYTIASNATWAFPLVRTTPQITISSGLQKLFGFLSQSSFPLATGTNNVSFLSNTYPTISPIFCYLVTCNLLGSSYNNVPTIFTQIPISKSFGSLIIVENSTEEHLPIRDGIYSDITIQFWDQNYNVLPFNDPELTLILIIESEK